jgi:hypothetical protein
VEHGRRKFRSDFNIDHCLAALGHAAPVFAEQSGCRPRDQTGRSQGTARPKLIQDHGRPERVRFAPVGRPVEIARQRQSDTAKQRRIGLSRRQFGDKGTHGSHSFRWRMPGQRSLTLRDDFPARFTDNAPEKRGRALYPNPQAPVCRV